LFGSFFSKFIPFLSGNNQTNVTVPDNRFFYILNEGFRVDDLKRWNTAIVEMPKPILGVKWTGTDFATSWAGASNMAKDSDGCLILENSRRWGSKNDLYPLPVDQCQLNPNLGQNPGWQ
jgi:hypothetical protein